MKIGTFKEYRGYVGTIEYSENDMLNFGSIIGIEDSISYHGNTIEDLYESYKNSVDNYIDLKNKNG